MAFTSAVDLYDASTSTNVLHYFRSYNYLFTLSCVENSSLTNLTTPSRIAEVSEKFVIAKSSGKGSASIDASAIAPIKRDKTAELDIKAQYDKDGVRLPPSIYDDLSGKAIVEDFNNNSSGVYDFYFNDIEIETLMSFNKRSGFSKATKMSFSIIEPYSLAGLLEALQVSAVAAGHPTYKSAPYILKLEFKGYADWDDSQSMKVEPATRYFIIRFSEMAIQADEQGTKYSCKAVPLNELGFGEPNKLKTNMNIKGDTVKDILDDLMTQINQTNREQNKVSKSASSGNGTQADEYEIHFPKDAGDYSSPENESLTRKKVAELSVDNVAYAFLDPVEKEKGTYKRNSPKLAASVQFSSGSNIHDCISSIIRDSEYGTDIFTNFKNRVDENDQIDYFNIVMESVPKDLWNDAGSQPFYIYKFYVVPYKIHYTQIPGYQNGTMDETKVNRLVRRVYNYMYTGQNRDVLSFNLAFNSLYFQNQPVNEGNQAIDTGSDGATYKPVGEVVTESSGSQSQDAQGSGSSVNERRVDIRTTEVNSGAGPSTRPLQKSPYSAMIKNLHQAIIDNVGMAQLDIEILGDPLYLVQNGIGNLRVKPHSSFVGLTETGDIDFQSGDIYVEINFRNPKDIGADGIMQFSETTSFSGLYKVLSVNSKFNNGSFTQRLSMIRMPAQKADTKQTKPKTSWVISTIPDADEPLIWNGEA